MQAWSKKAELFQSHCHSNNQANISTVELAITDEGQQACLIHRSFVMFDLFSGIRISLAWNTIGISCLCYEVRAETFSIIILLMKRNTYCKTLILLLFSSILHTMMTHDLVLYHNLWSTKKKCLPSTVLTRAKFSLTDLLRAKKWPKVEIDDVS